jgi:hypothetical protein
MAEEPSAAANGSSFVENSEYAVQLEQILRCRLGHRIFELRVWTEPHGFVLGGCSQSYYDKQMAQQIVKEISGLDVADNRIVVDSRATGANPAGRTEFPSHGNHAANAARIHRHPHGHRFSN